MSDASVGSIIGYLRLDRSDWDAELNAAGRKADELARHNPNVKISTNAPSAIAQLAAVAAATRRLQDAQGAENVAQAKLTDLRNKGTASDGQMAAAEERLARAHRATAAATIALAAAHDSNDTAVRRATVDTKAAGDAAAKSSFQMHLLRDAILLIGPAAIPIASVATGALLGLVPAAATAILGLKGITQEYQSGALAGTQYETDIKSLVDEFTNLKQTAASGLLGGVDQAIQSSQPLFGALNQDIGVMSNQLGTIVAGAGPALLQILTDLNPLFVTFGQLLSDGAAKLEHWATSSDGIQQFVAYVQTELPTVITALGQLVEVAGRLLAALAPLGHVVVAALGELASLLNAIPTGVLTVLATGAVAAYAAFRTYGAVKSIVDTVNGALEKHATVAAASAARTEAAMLGLQAGYAEEAAAAQVAAAEEAAAASERATAIAASVAGTESVLADGAAASAAAAAEQAAAFQATADAAIASAAEIRAAATAAAETIAAEGEVASVGWSAMLGPVGAIIVGVGILGATLFSSSQDAQKMQEEVNGLTDALKQDSGAVGDNTRAYVVNALQKSGALDAARNLGINLETLTSASLGNAAAQQAVGAAVDDARAKLDAAGFAHQKLIGIADLGVGKNRDLAQSILTVQSAVSGTTGALGKAAQAYANEQAALGANTSATDAQAAAEAKLYGLTGTAGVSAYLAATQAAQQNTQQSQQQTLQYQLESDAADLLKQSLDRLSGKSIDLAQAQNTLDSALVNMGDHTDATGKKIHFTTTSINNMSSASVELRGQLNNQVTSAESVAEAYGQMKGSSEAGREKLVALRQEIINNAVAHGVDRQAVTNYIDSILKIPKSVPPTKLQIDKSALEALKRELAAITARRYQINVEAVASGGVANLPHGVKAMASGGYIDGPGARGVDSQLRMLAPGEFVVSDRAVSKFGLPFMRALNAGSLRMPSASVATSQSPQGSPSPAMPSVLVVVDSDGHLIGRMRVEAQQTVAHNARQVALTGGRL